MRYAVLVALALAAALCAGRAAQAATNVLTGMPDYAGPAGPELPDAATPPSALARSPLPEQEGPCIYGGSGGLTGVPEYNWWYGCSPTSAGMLVGCWDGRSGYGNLFDGNAANWWGDGATGTGSMVAGTAHIVSGAENGYTYGYWGNGPSYPNHAANPDSLADFIRTVDGGSTSENIAAGLADYISWDNPKTAVDEGYDSTVRNLYARVRGGAFGYAGFKAEIDAGRPVLLDLRCALDRTTWVGHTVVAYGYQDDMFQVRVPVGSGGVLDLTVGGFAVRDTWGAGITHSDWVTWDDSVIPARVIDGVEWWPFVDCYGASWVYDDGTQGPYDWMVFDAVTADVAVPEPGGLTLLAAAALAATLRRRRLWRCWPGAGARPCRARWRSCCCF